MASKNYRVAKKTYTYVELQHMTEEELKPIKKLLRDNVTRNLRKLQKGGFNETPATLGLANAIESGIVPPMPHINISSMTKFIKKVKKAKAKKAKEKAKAKKAKEKAKAKEAKEKAKAEKAEVKEAKEKAKQLKTMAKEAKKKTELTEKQRLIGEIIEYQNYQASSTGTLAGMKKFESDTYERLGDAYRDSSIESKRKFWELYDEQRDMIENNGLDSKELQKLLANYFSARNGKRITKQRSEDWEAMVNAAYDEEFGAAEGEINTSPSPFRLNT